MRIRLQPHRTTRSLGITGASTVCPAAAQALLRRCEAATDPRLWSQGMPRPAPVLGLEFSDLSRPTISRPARPPPSPARHPPLGRAYRRERRPTPADRYLCLRSVPKQGGGDGRVNTPRRCSFSGRSARLPPFPPRRRGRRLHLCALSPKATEPIVQSSARQCVHVHGMLWSYPREINQVLLRSAPRSTSVRQTISAGSTIMP